MSKKYLTYQIAFGRAFRAFFYKENGRKWSDLMLFKTNLCFSGRALKQNFYVLYKKDAQFS